MKSKPLQLPPLHSIADGSLPRSCCNLFEITWKCGETAGRSAVLDATAELAILLFALQFPTIQLVTVKQA